MTRGFWSSVANGAFLPEYPLVRVARDRGWRRADAVILPNEPHREAKEREYPSLRGHDVIVVQTKRGRMGMYLMGQALFSARLALAQGATSVRSILLCHCSDSALLPLLSQFPEVEVWLSDPINPMICHKVCAAQT
jgi:hypothetical protein